MRVPLRVRVFDRYARRIFLGAGSPDSTSFEKEILCPDEETSLPPAIILPGQLDRVTGAPTESTVAYEIDFVTRPRAVHVATIAYHIKKATLFNGSMYAGTWRLSILEGVRNAVPEIYITKAGLASSEVGNVYFGHWLKDDCTAHIIAQKYGRPLCVHHDRFPHRNDYASWFGQDWQPAGNAQIDHLVVFQDFGQNSFKAARFRKLRSMLRARFRFDGSSKLIYLRRGEAGAGRLVENEEEILDALLKKGFLVLDVVNDVLEKIVSELLNAKIVVSVEGSHVSHCTAALPENSGIVLLQPASRFATIHRGWADNLSVRYGLVVGNQTNRGHHFAKNEILKTVDLMLKRIEAAPS